MTFFIDFKVSLFVFADKTTSLYEMSFNHNKTLLNNNITKTYLIADSTPNKTTTKKAKKLYKELNLEARRNVTLRDLHSLP